MCVCGQLASCFFFALSPRRKNQEEEEDEMTWNVEDSTRSQNGWYCCSAISMIANFWLPICCCCCRTLLKIKSTLTDILVPIATQVYLSHTHTHQMIWLNWAYDQMIKFNTNLSINKNLWELKFFEKSIQYC